MRTQRRTSRGSRVSSLRAAPAVHAKAAPAADRVTEKVLLALLALGIGHVLLYFFLTGDARSGLERLEIQFGGALEQVARPGPAAMPGTPAYSTWLRSYERWHASKDYALHGRHESLMRYGMLASFLIAVGFLGSGLLRHARSGPSRSSRPRERAPIALASRRPAAVPAERRRYRRSA